LRRPASEGIGTLVRAGVTGVAGFVSDLYLENVVRPEILFPAYLAGHNLIESYYLALPDLSWHAVIIGDPLCAPFTRPATTASDLDPPLDRETDLPPYYSTRLRARLAAAGPELSAAATTLLARATGQLARDDRAAALETFQRAIALHPTSVGLRLQLATVHEGAREFDAAIAQYREILELQPRNVAALNNLAYGLAVHRGALDEALPLARQAVALRPAEPLILDTLAWIEHLSGDHESAARRLADAVRLNPALAEVRLHAAIVFAATGAMARAASELKEAIRLNPEYASSPEVIELKKKLSSTPQGGDVSKR
jgi:tetratricopeptide (TPR) repeat protein